MSNPAKDLLHKTPVSEVVKDHTQAITLNTKDSLWTAVKVLKDNHIQACPVLDDEGKFQGFLDVRDITNYIVACAPDPSSLHNKPIQSLEIAGRAISLVPIQRVLAMATKGSDPIFISDPASHACQVFEGSSHQVALTDEHHKVLKVCSQMDIVKFLAHHLPDSMKELSLHDFGYGHCEVFTISQDQPVLSALQKIAIVNVGAIAVVDNDGNLVGNFSASDLKGLYQDSLPPMAMPIKEYLATHSASSLSPITCDPSKNLLHNMNVLVNNKLHHGWVVENNKPVGIVSLTDLITLVMTFSG